MRERAKINDLCGTYRLNTNQAFAMGTETLKLARIANLDYAKSTDLMTSAVRGFNMELNESSAQRVADVYASLAAKSASNVQELATAMSKTASLAHNVGMEFETTATFLAKGIEATREPAETIGTALKTVLARFAELKKPLEEMELVEGEEVNVNRIEKALRMAKVELRDANGEFRDFDSVLKELSKTWDDLDVMTQRYIATQAAGSRQQSRFIAMMAGRSRTDELLGYALDSEGASQKQFEKTLESIEAKLNKFKNAWNNFAMGIANSTIIKVAIDVLTEILNIVNALTDSMGPLLGGLTKSAIGVGMFMGAKKGANKLLDFGTDAWVRMLKGEGPGGDKATEAGVGFFKRFAEGFAKNYEAADDAGKIAAKSLLGGLEGGFTAGFPKISAMFTKLVAKLGTGGMIAAGVAIGGLLAYSIYNSYFSLEAKLKVAQKRTEDAQSAADEAKQAYDKLFQSADNYSRLQENLDNATKGTKEWRDALYEVNMAVLELMEKYPELASGEFIEKGLDGALKLRDGWQDAVAKILTDRQDQAMRELALTKTNESSLTSQKVWQEGAKGLTSPGYSNSGLEREISASAFQKAVESGMSAAEIKADLGIAQPVNIIEKAILSIEQQLHREEAKRGVYNRELADSLLRDRDLGKDANLAGEILGKFLGTEGAQKTLQSEKYDPSDFDNDINSIIKTMSDLDPIARKIIEGGKELTATDIQSINSMGQSAFSGLLGDLEDFYSADEWTNMKDIFDDIIANGPSKLIEEIRASYGEGVSDIFKDKNLTVGMLQSLQSQFELVGKRSGKDAVQPFARALEEAAKDLSDGDLVKFLETLATTDISSMDDLDDFKDRLNELGLTVPISEFDDFIERVKELAKATREADFERDAEIADRLSGLNRKLREEGSRAKIDKDEYAMLTEYDASMAAQFQRVEGGTYQLTGNVETVNSALEALWRKIFEVIDSAEINKGIAQTQFMNLQSRGTSWEGADQAQRQTWLEDNGLIPADQVDEIVTMSWDSALVAIKAVLDQKLLEEQNKVEQYNPLETQYAADKGRGSNVIQAENAIDSNDVANVEKYTQAVLQLAEADGAHKNSIELVNKALQNYKANQSEANAEALKARIFNLDAAKSVEELEKTYADLAKAAEDSFSVLNDANATLEQQEAALVNLANALSEAIGGTFDPQWLGENIELIHQYFDGAISGAELLARQMWDTDADFRNTLQGMQMSVLDFSNLVNNLETKLKVDGTADLSQILSEMGLVGTNAEELARMLSEIHGLSVEVVDLPSRVVPVTLPNIAAAMSSGIDGVSAAEVNSVTSSFTIPQVAYKVTKNNANVGGGYIPPKYQGVSRGAGGGGGGGRGGGGGGKGGGGAGAKPEKEWLGNLDQYYNLLEKIAEEERQIGKIHRNRNKAFEDGVFNIKQILSLRKQELDNLNRQYVLQKELLKGRLSELSKLGSRKFQSGDETKTFAQWGVTKYARYDQGEQRVIIDWEGIDKITNKDTGAAVSAWVNELERVSGSIESIQDQLESIEDAIKEAAERGRQEYLDLERAVYDALVAQQQKTIDELSLLHDTISNSSAQMLAVLQEQVTMQRQIRDNTKREEEIADKERRLAYLQQDGSSGNQLEILRLEKELDDARQAHTDSLIDQKIQELQKQNEEAALQRQTQIDIAQAQLDYLSNSGDFWPQVDELMKAAMEGNLEGMTELMKEHDNYKALSKFGKENWTQDWFKRVEEALQGLHSFLAPKKESKPTAPAPAKPSTTPAKGSSAESTPKSKTHTVSRGDTLWGIAAKYYGDGSKWRRIYDANKDKIGHPDLIFPGQKFLIPMRTGGYTGDWGGDEGRVALLHKKELILDAQDTANLIALKEALRRLTKGGSSDGATQGAEVHIQVDVHVEKASSQQDIDLMVESVERAINEKARYRNVNVINTLR